MLFRSADFLVAVAAVFLISDACLALLIKLVEVDVIVNGGLIQADRDQYKPHGDGAFVCNSHGNPFFLFRISVCNLGIFIQELLKKDRRLPVQSLLFSVYKLFSGKCHGGEDEITLCLIRNLSYQGRNLFK